MNAVEVQEHARRMWENLGPKAIAHAAQQARAFEQQGKSGEAKDWRRIEDALKLLNGPAVS